MGGKAGAGAITAEEVLATAVLISFPADSASLVTVLCDPDSGFSDGLEVPILELGSWRYGVMGILIDSPTIEGGRGMFANLPVELPRVPKERMFERR
jgi:hypothetical protein